MTQEWLVGCEPKQSVQIWGNAKKKTSRLPSDDAEHTSVVWVRVTLRKETGSNKPGRARARLTPWGCSPSALFCERKSKVNILSIVVLGQLFQQLCLPQWQPPWGTSASAPAQGGRGEWTLRFISQQNCVTVPSKFHLMSVIAFSSEKPSVTRLRPITWIISWLS